MQCVVRLRATKACVQEEVGGGFAAVPRLLRA